MKESGFYPPGAEFDPSAPWNQKEQEERYFNVYVSQTLSKPTEVCTTDYVTEYEDETGNYRIYTDCTDWKEVCKESDTYTPLELINEFKQHLEEMLEADEAGEGLFSSQHLGKRTRNKYRHLIEECSGWIEDDLDIQRE